MAGTNILKEFLVKISFSQDDAKKRQFLETMTKITKGSADFALGLKRVAEASALATTGLSAAITAVAKPLEAMYFAAQRTGGSVKELQSFSYAASQVGVSAEAAQASIEALAAARRTNPGLDGQLMGMGIKPGADNVKVMLSLLERLRHMPHYQAAQIASNFGLDENTLNQITNNSKEFAAALQKRNAMFAKFGIDPDVFDKNAHDWMNKLRDLGASVLDLSEAVASRLMPIGEKVIGWLQEGVDWFAKLDKSTDGWSSKILGLVVALKGLSSAFSILGKISGIGGGAAATGGEAAVGGAAVAGEGAAAAGGAGLLATIGLPVVVGAAIVAALVWMQNHPEQVRAAAKKTWEVTKKAAVAVGHAAKNEAHALPGHLHAAATAIGTFAQQVKSVGVHGTLTALAGVPGLSGAFGSLADMVAGFEGHVRGGYGQYKDIGGRLTAGFGHLVQKGEDFTHLDKQGALALLAKDLQTAAASIAGLVKVKLSKNQQDALSDFVFNVGKGNLAKSTLLKDINSGDFAGAAKEFEKWNHVLVNGHMVANQGLANRRAAEAKLFATPDKGVQIKQETNIHVTGGEAKETGREIARQQGRVNGDLIRNAATAVQ